MSSLTDATSPSRVSLTDADVQRLCNAVLEETGFDLAGYEPGFLRARLDQALRQAKVSTLTALQDHLLRNKMSLRKFVSLFSLGPDVMFQDPSFYISMRNTVIPGFRYFSALKVWNPGCANGAEAYTLSVLLFEAGVYERTRIFATDSDELTVEKARKGTLAKKTASLSAKNYLRAGCLADFTDYFTPENGLLTMRQSLLERISWFRHNAATDATFNQFHIIVCRSPLARLHSRLREKTLALFYESLTIGGVLGLTQEADVLMQSYPGCYRPLEESARIYRKIK